MNEGIAKKRAKELYNKQIEGWTVGKYVGSGKTAFICEALSKGDRYAIKIFESELLDDKETKELKIRLDRQLQLVGKKHENLVNIYGGGYCNKSKCYYLIMEYLDAPSLAKVIKDLPRHSIEPLISQIASAAHYLEDLELVHRDIKPDNIAVSPDYSKAILLDLGVICPLEKDEITDCYDSIRFVGTLRYSSPEFLLRQEAHTKEGWRAITFYQIGAVLHDMIMRYPIFEGHTEPYAKLVHAVQHELPNIYAEDVDPNLIHLANICLLKAADLRIQLIDWDKFNLPKLQSDRLELAKSRIKDRSDSLQNESEPNINLEEKEWRFYEQFIYDIHNTLETAIRNICVENKNFPRISISDGPTTKNFPFILQVSFPKSNKHRLKKDFVIFITVSILDIKAKLLQLQCAGILSDSIKECDLFSYLSVCYEGLLDSNTIYKGVDEMLHLIFDQAQQKYDPSADDESQEKWIIYKSEDDENE